MAKYCTQWEALKDRLNGKVRIHTLAVIYCLNHYSRRFQKLSERQKNILLWAALFHDITKRGPPIFEGKDHVHPFQSAGAFLRILADNFLPHASVEEKRHLAAMAEVCENAFERFEVEIELDYEVCNQLHDHSVLPRIFEMLQSSCLGLHSDLAIVFKLVLLH